MADKKKMFDFAQLTREVAEKKNDERAAKCGYDLLMGLARGDADERAKAWKDWLEDDSGSETTCERDGVWVPAVPL